MPTIMTNDVNLYVKRDALVRQLLDVDNVQVIEKVQKALKRALAALQPQASAEEETEYITREEQEEILLHAFTEMYRAQKEDRVEGASK
ncbi:MAG: hypothetical protein H9791_07115 [Candidatus Bacteroides intestinipullorum]|uniref:Uncharacterized protein n=1 Tax=Candidatus Bacteroides intestinipullorum TaxID=2838471 RepID=A0A9E2KGH2_9BACE|nr:hypothetical protein [Candidatus Bacteroides intestinipullorum]